MRKIIVGLSTITVILLGVVMHLELGKGKEKQDTPVEVMATPTFTPTLEPTIEPIITITPSEISTQVPVKTEEPTNAPIVTEKPKNKQNTKPKETDKPKATQKATEKPTTAPTKKPSKTPKPTTKPTSTSKPTVVPTQKPTPKPTLEPNDDIAKGREMVEKAGYMKVVALPNGNYGVLVPSFSFDYSVKVKELLRKYFEERNCDVDITSMVGGNWDDSTDRYFFELRKSGIYPR